MDIEERIIFKITPIQVFREILKEFPIMKKMIMQGKEKELIEVLKEELEKRKNNL